MSTLPQSTLQALELLPSVTLGKIKKDEQLRSSFSVLLERYETELLDKERYVLLHGLGVNDYPQLANKVMAKNLDVTPGRINHLAKRGLERLLELSKEPAIALSQEQALESASNAIIPYSGDTVERSIAWGELSDEERRRRAAKAAAERDVEILWDITSAYLTLYGAKGSSASKHTYKSYKQGLKSLLNEWQDINLLRPDTNAGVRWIRRLETQPVLSKRTGEPLIDKRTGEPRTYAASTVALMLAGARAFYRALRWTGATEATPFVDVKPAKDSVHPWEKREAYSRDEINRLLEVAEGADAVLVLLGAHAGLRISEATSLRWADVNLEHRRLRVVEGKGGKTASAVMSNRLKEALLAIAGGEASDFVLPYRDYRARERFYKLCLLAGVRYAGREFHGTRHHAGVQAYKQFGTFDRVAEHLRQADVNQGKRYGFMADETLSDGVKDW